MTCESCIMIVEGWRRRTRPAIARWTHWHGYTSDLCQSCLDAWFDNADDDESLEPAAWSWLTERSAA